ncbi:MAG: NfeD family protein [Thermomicrobiales bacterium]
MKRWPRRARSPESDDQSTRHLVDDLRALGRAAPARPEFLAELEARLLAQAAPRPTQGGRVRRATHTASRRAWHALAFATHHVAAASVLVVFALALFLTLRAATANTAATGATPTAAPTAVPVPATNAVATSAGAPVVVTHLDGAIDPISARYLRRAVATARDQHAAALVVVLNTPGGLDSSMRQMVGDLLNAPMPTIVYVAPGGAHAASAGLFVAQAADIVAMAPGTAIGAAHPVNSNGDNISSDERDKVTNDAAAYLVGITGQHNRNTSWVEQAVRQSVALDAQGAVAAHVADLTAPDLPTLLASVNGQTVKTPAGTVTLHTAGTPQVSVNPSVVEQAAQLLIDPTIAYLLLTVGFFAILIELFHPGTLVPGLTGAVSLILAFVAFAAMPLNWGGVLLILAALVLFVVDIKAATHGALTVAGLVCFVLGSLLLYTPPGPRSPTLPAAHVALPVLLLVAGVIAGLTLAIVGAAVRVHRRPPIVAWSPQPGALGVASTALAPEGVVQVGGQSWSARLLAGTLAPGQPVRVLSRKGLTLEVAPTDNGVVKGEEGFPYGG